MKGYLVYDIVRRVAIHPRNELRKRNIAGRAASRTALESTGNDSARFDENHRVHVVCFVEAIRLCDALV